MSFWKGVGRTVGGFLGIRTGASKQARDFAEENTKKQLREFWDFKAQETALKGQSEIQDAWDSATRRITGIEEQEALRAGPKVELGQADPKKRNSFFRFGV